MYSIQHNVVNNVTQKMLEDNIVSHIFPCLRQSFACTLLLVMALNREK